MLFQNETKEFVAFWTTCAVLGIPNYRAWELYFVREVVKEYETYDVNFIRHTLKEIPLAIKLGGTDLSSYPRTSSQLSPIKVMKKLSNQSNNYLLAIVKQYKESLKPKMNELSEHDLKTIFLMGALAKY